MKKKDAMFSWEIKFRGDIYGDTVNIGVPESENDMKEVADLIAKQIYKSMVSNIFINL